MDRLLQFVERLKEMAQRMESMLGSENEVVSEIHRLSQALRQRQVREAHEGLPVLMQQLMTVTQTKTDYTKDHYQADVELLYAIRQALPPYIPKSPLEQVREEVAVGMKTLGSLPKIAAYTMTRGVVDHHLRQETPSAIWHQADRLLRKLKV